MSKQMAELDNFGNSVGQQTGSIFGVGQQRSLLEYFGSTATGMQGLQQQLSEITGNIDTMKKDTDKLDQMKAKVSGEIHQFQTKLDQIQKEKDALLLQQEAARNMGTPDQIKKFYKEESKRLHVQQSQVAQDLSDAEKEHRNLE